MIEDKIKEIGISSEVGYLFPKHCSSCDLPLELSVDLTLLKCPNPFCRILYLERSVIFCEVLGLTQFGYSFFERLVNEFNWTSDFISDFYKVSESSLKISDKEFASRFELFKESVSNVKKGLSLETYLLSLGLPMLEDIVGVICENYTSLEEFYAELDIVLDFEGYLALFGLSVDSKDLILRYLEVFTVYRKDLLGYRLDD